MGSHGQPWAAMATVPTRGRAAPVRGGLGGAVLQLLRERFDRLEEQLQTLVAEREDRPTHPPQCTHSAGPSAEMPTGRRRPAKD